VCREPGRPERPVLRVSVPFHDCPEVVKTFIFGE